MRGRRNELKQVRIAEKRNYRLIWLLTESGEAHVCCTVVFYYGWRLLSSTETNTTQHGHPMVLDKHAFELKDTLEIYTKMCLKTE